MMEEILDIVLRLIGILFAGVITPLLCKWLNEKIGDEKMKQLQSKIDIFVGAAEQTLKENDPDGKARNEYVCNELKKLGIELTDIVLGMIEDSVLKVNRGGHK